MDTIYKTTSKDESYRLTLKALRVRNFSRNLPFLMLSDKLPEGQVYREYADGHIEVQEVFTVGSRFHHKLLKVLPAREADKVRSEYGLL
jgi:hypothetical protein